MNRKEVQMIEPVRQLMLKNMNVDVVAEEFSAGYGFADLVGAKLCGQCCKNREQMGMAIPLDHRHLVRVLLSLNGNNKMSISSLLEQAFISESTLRSKVLPQLRRMGLIKSEPGGFIKLLNVPPKPTEGVIAVEAKQTRWRDAMLQARRYSYFAEQSYIAVWKETLRLVDQSLLATHQLGLIGVEIDSAEVVIEAPKLIPRQTEMNWFCAEFLYGLALNTGVIDECAFKT